MLDMEAMEVDHADSQNKPLQEPSRDDTEDGMSANNVDVAEESEHDAAVAKALAAARPTLYRVVYKMVAVREHPDTNAPSIRAKKRDEIVEMFEWDSTKAWRRVRVQTTQEGSSELVEQNGWMLIHSEKVGALLEEIHPTAIDKEEEEDDEDLAG